MKEEIFDFDKHKGRRIKVLINCPLGGNVKKGEIGVLKYDNVADFPSQSGYSCGGGDNFYKRFELLPEDAVKEPQFEVEQFKKYVLKETVTKVGLSKQEPMKTAVHVKTSEEFDFVISKIREKSDRYNRWNVYRTESCISSDFGEYQNKDWFSKNNYKVVSFEDWCEDNEYIFVTQELKEEELKVGDYAVVLKGYRGSNFTPGNIVKLVLDEKDGFQCLYVRTPYSKNTPFIYTKNLRKATTQEILAETLPTVIGHIKNPFEITNAQENINILPKPKELEIVPISKYFKIRN